MLANLLILAGATAALLAPSPTAHLLREGDRFAPGIVRDAGNGIAYLDRAVRAAEVRGITADGAYRVVETSPAAAGRLTIADIRATNVRRGLARIRGDLTGTIRDCDVSFAPVPQVPPHLPEGIAFDGTAHDWLIEKVTIRGAQMVMPPERYWNGDGISSELGNTRLTFRNVAVYDSTDAGFDLKSSDTTLDNTIAGGNSRNYRLWQSANLGTITSIEPVVRGGRTNPAHVWITGKFTPVIRIHRLIVRATTSQAAVIRIEDGTAEVIVESADIRVPKGTPLVVGHGTVRWLSGEPRL